MAVKYAARTLVWARATASNFTTVATINSVNEITPGFGATRGEFDQSTFGDEWMDFGIAQMEGDEFTLRILYDFADATHLLLRGDFHTPSANVWIQASHTAMDARWNITTVPRGWRVVPDRAGNMAVEATYRVVSPGVVEQAIP